MSELMELAISQMGRTRAMSELLEMAIGHMEYTRVECRTPNIIASCDAAIEAMREKLEREKNEPLTVDELLKMDGKPVLYEGIKSGHKEWIILRVITNECIAQSGGSNKCPVELGSYGKTWFAYRYEKDAAVD